MYNFVDKCQAHNGEQDNYEDEFELSFLKKISRVIFELFIIFTED